MGYGGIITIVVKRGTSGSRDCRRAFNYTLNVSTVEAFIISAGTLFQYWATEGMLATSGVGDS